MSNSAIALETGCRETVARSLGPAQARWERLSISDYAGIETTGDLINAVARRYSLTYQQANLEVQDWLQGVGFGAGLVPLIQTR